MDFVPLICKPKWMARIFCFASKGNIGMKTVIFKKAALNAALAFTLASSVASAFARDSGAQVEGTLNQSRIVVVNGKETVASADKVSPGDLIEYKVRYVNKGAGPAKDLVVTLPIPKGLELAQATDSPKASLASLDGQKFEAMPIKRLVKQADGKELMQEVSLSQYRALRWQVGQLDAGKAANFSARARVEALSISQVSQPVAAK
jgi:uncharacterized repeat protein (TIGR01451 family)